ncbi:FAD-binding oxidoreductase [Leisingera aquaemixtae]|uniref:NAD(P)/FAD-dependent oxidoreductase n=1 Tax=Leisingera aquaemixtae TaxID=1396826 RepID=UPI0021A5B641|nr:FAD-dependent oxidoreductase [Leisingera aquaemixtae]UWQ37386.1 FAD-binding oxidoreductase [Leisingera aquaemixtae]
MRRIFSDYAYGPGPRSNCWWDETIAAPDWPVLQGEASAEVAIIGGGFTGVSAALHLAESGVSVAVLEAETPGWGASGRNGGFCCLGGSKLSGPAMRRMFGKPAAESYEAGEEAAVHLVRDLLQTHGIDADTHSDGETQLAHNEKAARRLRAQAEAMRAAGGEPDFLTRSQLAQNGLNGSFHAALTTPVGFALNPRKYLFGLAGAAQNAGASLYQHSAARSVRQDRGGYRLETKQGVLRAAKVIIATNGYSSEDLPGWLAGRYMPAQSTVMVTRPLTKAELQAQGWASHQMAYDTRNLLHYFRLMPDKRFLFGMRGGLLASPRAETAIRHKLRQDFEAMFPAWHTVETTHCWSGMVCLSRNLVPFVGAVPEMPGIYAGLCYHGNGVAMGSYAGRLLSDLVQDRTPDLPYSPVMQNMPRFPFGRARRILMPPAYALLGLMD